MAEKKAGTKVYGPYPDPSNNGFSGKVKRGKTEVWAGGRTKKAAEKKLKQAAKVLSGTRMTD
jgi:hypothetical protein